MRIDEVRVTRFEMPRVDRNWRTATYANSSVTGFALEITAGGKTGTGGTAAHPSQITPENLESELRGPVCEALAGVDALDGPSIRERLSAQKLNLRSLVAADLALHDLMGNLAGLPCYALWGGKAADHVDVVRMVGIKTVAELEPAVAGFLDQGYTHFKIKIGTGLEEDVERIAMLRRVFGSRIWIGVDGNGAYDVDGVIELSRKLEQFDVKLIEQPIDYKDVDGLVKVSAASRVPIMADQCVYDVASALDVCQRKAAPVVSIKVSKMGTIEECRRVAEVCVAFGVGVHIGGSVVPSVVDVAAAHLAVAVSGISSDCEVGECRAVTGDLIAGGDIREGKMYVGELPGLGVKLQASALSA
jgi:L-Ala-D/L-Glu epimerase / N-acetyl-D-glutamate racemase